MEPSQNYNQKCIELISEFYSLELDRSKISFRADIIRKVEIYFQGLNELIKSQNDSSFISQCEIMISDVSNDLKSIQSPEQSTQTKMVKEKLYLVAIKLRVIDMKIIQENAERLQDDNFTYDPRYLNLIRMRNNCEEIYKSIFK